MTEGASQLSCGNAVCGTGKRARQLGFQQNVFPFLLERENEHLPPTGMPGPTSLSWAGLAQWHTRGQAAPDEQRYQAVLV